MARDNANFSNQPEAKVIALNLPKILSVPMATALISTTVLVEVASAAEFPALPAIHFLLFTDVAPIIATVPVNQFNVGDSIGEGEAADGTVGSSNHENVWSSGYSGTDSVSSLNERFENEQGQVYYQNTVSRDAIFNKAASGAVMGDFSAQAGQVVNSAADVPGGEAGMVSVLLGANDVCAATPGDMTDVGDFEAQFRSGLDVLAASTTTRSAQIHVSSIPAIYWLWEAKRDDFLCRLFIWPEVPCENLLDEPEDDCAAGSSVLPDVIDTEDGENCTRRKQFHARIRDEYNPVLENVTEEYRNSGDLANAHYIDIFDVHFGDDDINDGDCFHPSEQGQALLAEKHWCRSKWGENDPGCASE